MYPRDLDEYHSIELIRELERRIKLESEHKCNYCGQDVCSPKCRFPERHVIMLQSTLQAMAHSVSG